MLLIKSYGADFLSMCTYCYVMSSNTLSEVYYWTVMADECCLALASDLVISH